MIHSSLDNNRAWITRGSIPSPDIPNACPTRVRNRLIAAVRSTICVTILYSGSNPILRWNFTITRIGWQRMSNLRSVSSKLFTKMAVDAIPFSLFKVVTKEEFGRSRNNIPNFYMQENGSSNRSISIRWQSIRCSNIGAWGQPGFP